MQLEELDKILSSTFENINLSDFAFFCSFDFKEKFNNLTEYKSYPVYYTRVLKEEMIYFMPNITTENKEWINQFN